VRSHLSPAATSKQVLRRPPRSGAADLPRRSGTGDCLSLAETPAKDQVALSHPRLDTRLARGYTQCRGDRDLPEAVPSESREGAIHSPLLPAPSAKRSRPGSAPGTRP